MEQKSELEKVAISGGKILIPKEKAVKDRHDSLKAIIVGLASGLMMYCMLQNPPQRPDYQVSVAQDSINTIEQQFRCSSRMENSYTCNFR